MEKISFLIIFSILVSVITSTGFAHAGGDGLTVSNIGSSGQDGVSSNIGSSGQDGVAVKQVPAWIKTSMKFWVDGQTSDEEFLNAVEFLANEQIIHFEAEIPFMAGPIPMSDGDSENGTTGINSGGLHVSSPSTSPASETVQTEILSMDLTGHSSFFDVFYETYTVDSFFDVFTEIQDTTDSFFDVFFEVETPRTVECRSGQELKWDEDNSSWICASADTTNSFFDVFFEVSTDTAQNTEDIEELENKILILEKKIAELEAQQSNSGDTVDRSSEYYTP